MSIFEKKEKNLNMLIDKLNVLTSTYSQSSYEKEKIYTEKNDLIRKKAEVEKKKPRTDEGTSVSKEQNTKFTT